MSKDRMIPVELAPETVEAIEFIVEREGRTFQFGLDELGNKALDKVLDDFFEFSWREKGGAS